MGVVASFRFVKPVSIFYKTDCERYSISNDTIMRLFNFARPILITALRFNQLVTIERYWQTSIYGNEKL